MTDDEINRLRSHYDAAGRSEGDDVKFLAGDAVWWNYEPRGGYGYIIKVPAVVAGVTPKRVTIWAVRADDTQVKRVVKATSIERRYRDVAERPTP